MKGDCRPLRAIFLCAAICLLPGGLIFAQAQPAPSPAGQQESEALYRLTEFVDWPPAAGSQAGATFHFCILGQDPFGASLDDTVLGHPVGNEQTTIVRGNRLSDMGHCDVLFVGSSEIKQIPKILSKLRDKGVLTVSKATDFAANGGIIQFSYDEDHLSFVINVDAAQKAGLKIRAQLLSLAKIVHGSDLGSKE